MLNDLLQFLQVSPTPFHAVVQCQQRLNQAGFQSLVEAKPWQLSKGGKYYVIRNDSSIIAFVLGQEDKNTLNLRMIGAHTDSPCLKVKPQPDKISQGYYQLGVEVYGGALLHPWFDRDLSLAGRVSYINDQGQLSSRLVDFKQAIAIIPSLAIHFDREANKSHRINPQTDVVPVLAQTKDAELTRLNLKSLLAKQFALATDRILDFELYFYDTQAAAIIGLEQEFVASARLDNLLSCYVGLQALIQQADSGKSCLFIANDHEEVGSHSFCGAAGPFLSSVLKRLFSAEEYEIMIANSRLISVDNAHGIHPNFADKHDGLHTPLLNHGPVIKTNANQRYATNSDTASLFRYICQQADIPVQDFVTRTDLACGSTIGPITATEIGVNTLDIGVATFAMHSIRELAGIKDIDYLYRALLGFLVE